LPKRDTLAWARKSVLTIVPSCNNQHSRTPTTFNNITSYHNDTQAF